MYASCTSASTYFNSRPSARGDRAIVRRVLQIVVFQFTPLREGRLSARQKSPSGPLFQFTPLREGRPNQEGHHARKGYDFNSRPSARGDLRELGRDEGGHHFNSRPSARGDCTSWEGKAMNKLFQFTPLREGRLREAALMLANSFISIHAPPRGATLAK